MRFRRLHFEHLERRLVYSAAIVGAPRASAWGHEPASVPAAAVGNPPIAGGDVSPSLGGPGQFDGRRTIPYVNGSFTANQQEAVSTVYVIQDQVFHFVLAAADWGVPSTSGVYMSIRDPLGLPVFSMAAAAGKTQTAQYYLDAGTYTVVFVRNAPGLSGVLRFELGGVTLPPADTTQDPADESSSLTLEEYSFYWLPPHSVPMGIPVQQPSTMSALASSNYGATTGSHFLVSASAEVVAFPSSQAERAAAAPRVAGSPGRGSQPAGEIPSDLDASAVSASLENPMSAFPPASNSPLAPSPSRAPPPLRNSAVRDASLRDRPELRTVADAPQPVVATEVAEPQGASGIVMPVRNTSPRAEPAGLLWHWLALVIENLNVSRLLAPVVVALGWCAWRARPTRKDVGDGDGEFPPADFAANPMRSLAQ